jgi:hypothetical protein
MRNGKGPTKQYDQTTDEKRKESLKIQAENIKMIEARILELKRSLLLATNEEDRRRLRGTLKTNEEFGKELKKKFWDEGGIIP